MLAHPNGDRQLIDVREPHEVEIAALPGFETLSLSEFAHWSDNIQERYKPDQETVVLCHHGIRSDQMAHWLVDQGFSKVKNVVGGIDAYSRLIDATIPRY
ncbi:rhodanese-like domain-containing protein [Synechocystis salina]|uniref:rhodanese-like domain-containing protein n=1 Tax=Synechocystis salina TaxID=945780 RepID=UPI001D14A042|nr:rhodanese-like domain-containing protein [Synechocystis salina]